VGIKVLSGSKLLIEAVMGALRDLDCTREFTLVLDYPLGLALTVCPSRHGSQVVVTESASPYYLQELLRKNPLGLLTGCVTLAQLRHLLEQISQGNTLPQLPKTERVTLRPKEWAVLRLVVQGLDNEAIAARLKISAKSVANLVQTIKTEMGVQTRTAMVARYYGLSTTPQVFLQEQSSLHIWGSFPYANHPTAPTLDSRKEVRPVLQELSPAEAERVVGGATEPSPKLLWLALLPEPWPPVYSPPPPGHPPELE
jgi:DNA-binding CsgD family transcriptional regulator